LHLIIHFKMELAELTANQTAPTIGALASSDGIHADAPTHSSSSTSSTEQQQQQQQSGSKSTTTTTAGSKREEWAQRLTRSLSVLVRMAANAECLHLILPSLSEHVSVFVRALQETNHLPCHSMMATFLHNLLKVFIASPVHFIPISFNHGRLANV
jgi:hypothetical protein